MNRSIQGTESYEQAQHILAVRETMPLEWKVEMTQQRLKDWQDSYISFSGGLGSRVLIDIAKQGGWQTNKPIAHIHTGIEYPGVRKQGHKYADFIIRPKITYKQVVNKYGYPIISKVQANAIYKLRNNNLSERYRNKLLYGDEKGTAGMLSKKFHYLLEAPFKINGACCDLLKKRPAHKFEKENDGVRPITAEMIGESRNRRMLYLKNGCNMHDLARPKSTPMAFWTEQDLLEYAKIRKLDYAEEYGDIVRDENGKYCTTGESRTGCVACMFGCHLEKGQNRFQRMKIMYPKIHNYVVNFLGNKQVLEYMGLEWE